MKSLMDYIIEHSQNVQESAKPTDAAKTFDFNFAGVDGAEEFLKELTAAAEEEKLNFNATETSFSITITREQCADDSINDIKTKLEKFIKDSRKGMKNASSETYAQKTHALLNLVEEMIEFIEDADEEENDTKGQDSQNQDVPKNDDLQNQELNNKE
jgi:leucyl-tRNA synthetase